MKITIDTKQDSHEDIMKVMQILHHIVQKGPGDHIQRGFSEPASEPVDSSNMMSMFANPSGSSTSSTPTASSSETAPNFGSFLNLTNKEEEKKEAKVEFF